MEHSSYVERIGQGPLRAHFKRHGLAATVVQLAIFEALRSRRRRKRGPGPEDLRGALPVEPDRPSNLSGGAAAELNFDD